MRPFPLKPATDQLKGLLEFELVQLLEGAEADLRILADQIAPVLVSAAATGDEELTDELVNQLELIADIQKIRVSGAFWRTILGVSRVALGALTLGLRAAEAERGGGA